MTLDLWKQSIRTAKMRMGINPNTFMKVSPKLFREAQKIYVFLMMKKNIRK